MVVPTDSVGCREPADCRRVKSQPDRSTTFHYDGLGRRAIVVSPDGVETRYPWCGGAICQSKSNDLYGAIRT